MKKLEIVYKIQGEPNQYFFQDSERWFAHIQLNGELSMSDQISLIERLNKAMNSWRSTVRLGRKVKFFRVNLNKPTEKIERQLELAKNRFFWNEREVSSKSGWNDTDFRDGFITYRLEGYERH